MLPFSYEMGELRLELLNLRFLPAKNLTRVFELPADEDNLFLWKT